MSVRQDVFDYLEKNPMAPLTKVLAAFADLKESTVRRYFFEYQKIESTIAKPHKKQAAKPTTAPASNKTSSTPLASSHKNIKKQIYSFMHKAPETKLRELAKAFPDLQKTTIGSYRRQWLREQTSPKQDLSKSKRSEILSFLDNNPTSNINDLKKVFPDVSNKLVTVFRSWKNAQNGAANPAKATITASKPQHPKNISTPDDAKTEQNWLEKHKETIARQKEIIEKQKERIELLKARLPSARKTNLIDSIKNFIIDKLTKK